MENKAIDLSSDQIITDSIINQRYKIIKKIGQGGLGRVFQAVDLNSGQNVAIKFIHKHLLDKKKIIGIFHRELLISSSLEHKNIVSYRGNYFKPPICFIVSDFIDGWNGYQFSSIVGKLPPIVAISVVFEILHGLDYIHMHDVIHSDLSISNIMIEKNSRVLVSDFGLSFEEGFEDYKNKKVGTPGYMSPEHVLSRTITVKSDIYCVGLILYKLITGEQFLPKSKNYDMALDAMREKNLERLNFLDKNLQKGIRKILKKSLSYNRIFRYSTARDMLISCSKLLRLLKIDHPRFAIAQFLFDKKLTDQKFEIIKQNIYLNDH